MQTSPAFSAYESSPISMNLKKMSFQGLFDVYYQRTPDCNEGSDVCYSVELRSQAAKLLSQKYAVIKLPADADFWLYASQCLDSGNPLNDNIIMTFLERGSKGAMFYMGEEILGDLTRSEEDVEKAIRWLDQSSEGIFGETQGWSYLSVYIFLMLRQDERANIYLQKAFDANNARAIHYQYANLGHPNIDNLKKAVSLGSGFALRALQEIDQSSK